jgi:hypothetical protein
MGIVEVAFFAACAAGGPPGHDHRDVALDEIADQFQQPIVLAVGPA